jgi:hypothetical protein
VRDNRYHGGFDHPVRSFLIGVTLLTLLFAGFVVGVEAGTHPSSIGEPSTITLENQRLRVVTVQQPVVRTTVGGTTRIVRLVGPGRNAAVVRDGRSTLVGFLSDGHRGRTTVESSAFQKAGTIYVPEPTTVTETVTATETETQTETVTTTTTDGSTSSDSTSTP